MLLENAMGHFTISNVIYSILGIQSFNADDSKHVTVDKKMGIVTLEQDLYFGNNQPPKNGESVFIAVQTEGRHVPGNSGEGSECWRDDSN